MPDAFDGLADMAKTTPAETDDEAIARLTKLPALEYERVR